MVLNPIRVQTVVKSLTTFTEKTVVKLTLEAHANLVRAPSEGGTPVDTGWARANWVPEIGKRFEGTAGNRGSAEQGIIDQAPAQKGIAEVALRYRLKDGPVFVSNNVPYIESLNDGSSKQAPSGFVQSALLEAINTVTAAPPQQT